MRNLLFLNIMTTLTAGRIEQREQSDACIGSAESRKMKTEGQQIEQKKQLLAEKVKEIKVLYDELVEAGVIELSDNDLDKAAGGAPIYLSHLPNGQPNALV